MNANAAIISVIRRATPADLPTLKALIESAYRGDSARAGWTHEADLLDGERIGADELALILGTGTPHVLLADVGPQLAGCVAVTDLGEKRAYLGMLCVDPARQAAGLGRHLIAAAEAHAHTAFGATTMEMTVIARRHELIAWYNRRGYQQSGERRPFPIEGIDLPMAVLARAIR